jgi:STE24 endopeptidase
MEVLSVIPRWYEGYHQEGWVPSQLPIFELAFIFTISVFTWEIYLDIRQHIRLKSKGGVVPDELAVLVKRLDEESLKRIANRTKEEIEKDKENAEKEKKKQDEKDEKIEDGQVLNHMQKDAPKFQAYGLTKSSFGLIKSFWSLFQDNTLLFLGIYPYLWDFSTNIAINKFGFQSEDEIMISLIFVGIQMIMDIFMSLPWSLYSTFVVEEKHGFNKTTPGLFFKDLLISTSLTIIIGGPVLYILLRIIKWGGEYFYIYVWGFLFAFSIFFLTIFPIWIQPLFNKYEPLEDGELKDAIFKLADRLHFPLTKLYVVDGSKRSSHSNAYLYGFFKNKRIVLFDTLIKQMTVPELEAVLGHEIGHWAHSHVLQMFVIQQLYFLAMFAGFGMAMNEPQLYLAFGFNPATKPTLIGLMLFMSTIWAPVDKMLSFILTLNTRRNEFQADQYSVNLNYGPRLKMGLVKMSIENRSTLDPDPLYSLYHYSHPPLIQRLSAIDEGMKKKA